MKEVKVIHIHDGDLREMTNQNWHAGGEAVWAGNMLSLYRNAGYEIIQIIPEYAPAEQGRGYYTFYKDGFTVILEREAGSGPDITEEDWEAANVLSEWRQEEIARREEEEAAAFFEEFDFSEEEFDSPETDEAE